MTDTATPHPATPPPASSADSAVVDQAIQSRRFVRLGDLVVEYKFWTNPRRQTGLDKVSIDGIAASILAGTVSEVVDHEPVVGKHGPVEPVRTIAGIRVALEVVKIKGPNASVITLIIDGQRRFLAAKAAKLPDDALVPVVDLEPEPVEWTRELAGVYLLRAFDTVATRAGLSSFEIAQGAKALRETKDPDTGKEYTLQKISQKVGRSETWVSRMLGALNTATAKVIHQWETGQLTDEQFKDAAALKDRQEQQQVADKAVEARQSGDRAGARALIKEQKIIAKARDPKPTAAAKPVVPPAKPAKPGKEGKPAKAAAVVRGPQGTLPGVPPEPRKPPAFAVIEDFLGLEKRKPPTHDHVRGFMEGARWVAGLLDPANFSKPMLAYMRGAAGAAAKPDDKPKAKSKAKPKKKDAWPTKPVKRR
jgi:ParB-like chromosome segregation protein Spo0J